MRLFLDSVLCKYQLTLVLFDYFLRGSVFLGQALCQKVLQREGRSGKYAWLRAKPRSRLYVTNDLDFTSQQSPKVGSCWADITSAQKISPAGPLDILIAGVACVRLPI